jgi:hypothetical protein
VEPKTPIIPSVTAERTGPRALIREVGQEIAVHQIGSLAMFEAEGVLTDDSFLKVNQENVAYSKPVRLEKISAHLQSVTGKFKQAGAVVTSIDAELGFFTMLLPYHDDLFASVRKIETDSRVILNPVVLDVDAIRSAKAFKPANENMAPRVGRTSRNSTEAFSGLARIGAVDFVKKVETELGTGHAVNGSSVRLGITDTGITYNHPAFLSASGKNRIVYMKDFTGEGFAYFHPQAKFQVAPGPTDSELIVNAEVLVTPRLPARPTASRLSPIADLKIRVSSELRELLLNPATVARLGFINEALFQGEGEAVDVNVNGKATDRFYLILIQGATPAEDLVYFDTSGTGDFRNARVMRDWNVSGDTVNVFAEKFGLMVASTALPTGRPQETLDVRVVSLVGFDPGNHGSHVAGIAAGLKTIANDADDTLARGVAPEASLVIGRVCANTAGCGATAAIADLARNGKAEVINMSLGGLSPFNDGYGVQETVINRLTAINNVLFVISAGNSGPGRQTVGSPSVARRSLSVGASANLAMIERQYQWQGAGAVSATPDSDFMLFFSSRGPTAAGGFKPNVVAPGTQLSAIQLNSAPGMDSGMDVYWGTSMSAPTAAGAYALLLDGVKKYNALNPSRALSTNAMVLRDVIIHSARAFDAKTFDPETGVKSDGHYTWIDQGTGMINLPAAWELLKSYRDSQVPTAVALNGTPVELDYQVVVSAKNPNGISYDGSRKTENGVPPAFATGLYLDFQGKDILRQVHLSRRLPESLVAHPALGELSRQLSTTRDEFVLKTVIHGSDVQWLKAGVADQLPCMNSEPANLSLLGKGVEYNLNSEGKVVLNPSNASILNVCVDRQAVRQALAPGDHGALIYGYRLVDGKVSPLPSFVVPVYLSVPHRIMTGNQGYVVSSKARAFGLSRNYVIVPEGTSVVRVTLEVPEPKLDVFGNVLPETCSGVELMALTGVNNDSPFVSRAQARAQNCDASGAPAAASRRKITFSSTNPRPGVWDLHVFGQYKFVESSYTLRVDYVTGSSSIRKIEGKPAALNGTFIWTLKEASSAVRPDSNESKFTLAGLKSVIDATVKSKEVLLVPGPAGTMRTYPAEAKSVEIRTGGSPGNDIDLYVLECPAGLAAPDETLCAPVGVSGKPADEESVDFEPSVGKSYAVFVEGYQVKDAGRFQSTEVLNFEKERGQLSVTGAGPDFVIEYAFSPAALSSSPILTHPLVTGGMYSIAGDLVLSTAEGSVLDTLSVEIRP